MNAFKILNNKSEDITNTINEIVAKFWGHEVNSESYATPSGDYTTTNWKDCIGFQIAYPRTQYTSGWDNVKNTLFSMHLDGVYDKSPEEIAIKFEVIQNFLKPYIELIDHFKELGFTPIQIK